MPRKKKTEEKLEEQKEEKSMEVDEAKLEEIKEKPKLEKFDVSSLKKDDKKITDLIQKLSKEGMSQAKIGLILRDSHGVPKSKLLGKKMGKILREKGIGASVPEDLANLLNRSNQLKKHLEKNKQDKTAKRGLQLTEAKIKKLSTYYKKKKILQEDWKR